MPFPRIFRIAYMRASSPLSTGILGVDHTKKNQAILLWVWVVGLPSCYGWNIPVI